MTEHTQDDPGFRSADPTVEDTPVTEGEAMCVSRAAENAGNGRARGGPPTSASGEHS